MVRERALTLRRASAATSLALVLLLHTAATAASHVARTVHNLSAEGPGQIKSDSQTAGVCSFCHIPHGAAQTRGLWSRSLPVQTYKLYESSTTQATLKQPTGSSRLCLSCHDGTIALGATQRNPDLKLGVLTGGTVLGSDLSDDHPISFAYDQDLVNRRPTLLDPKQLPSNVKLDENQELQCTSCHDAHQDEFPKFLVMDPTQSRLCVTCHQIPNWADSAHATSGATARAGGKTLPGLGYPSVAENGCESCHSSHSADHPVRLLRGKNEEDTCLVCHDGSVARLDLAAEFEKPSAHRLRDWSEIHDPIENPLTMPEHVACVDCHDPHEARSSGVGGGLSGALTGVSGLSVDGGVLAQANFDYEVCLKCHGTREAVSPVVVRQDAITNVRLEIDPRNTSFHPVAGVGREPIVPGLVRPLTAASLITCTSCHDNDAVGTGAPRGAHGSIYPPILVRDYRIDGSSAGESAQLYALCYTCHDRTVLLGEGGGSGPFPHRQHVVEDGASCAVCHDAHGSRNSPHLINFMLRDRSRAVVVSGTIAYESVPGGGRCSLSCHGKDHDGLGYGTLAEEGPATAPLRALRRRAVQRRR
jgi:predicted CXXCH cytochrome family protein